LSERASLIFLPIGIVLALLTTGVTQTQTVYDKSGEVIQNSSGGITAGLFLATVLMILFTGRYPRGLFDLVVGVNSRLRASRPTRRYWSPTGIRRSPSPEPARRHHLDDPVARRLVPSDQGGPQRCEQPAGGLDHGRSVPGQEPPADQSAGCSRKRLRAVGAGESVGLVGEHCQIHLR
jgi:hypothetical protein